MRDPAASDNSPFDGHTGHFCCLVIDAYGFAGGGIMFFPSKIFRREVLLNNQPYPAQIFNEVGKFIAR